MPQYITQAVAAKALALVIPPLPPSLDSGQYLLQDLASVHHINLIIQSYDMGGCMHALATYLCAGCRSGRARGWAPRCRAVRQLRATDHDVREHRAIPEELVQA